MGQRTALITGASAGIGAAFAEVFASKGFDLVLTARRADRLNAVAAGLRERHGRRVEVVVLDHSEPGAAERLCNELDSRGIIVDALVNNAGYGVPGLYVNVPWATQDTMLRVMVVGVAELTRRLWPGMLERGYGRVINVASLAGLVPAPAGHTLVWRHEGVPHQVLRGAGPGGAPARRPRDGALSRLHAQRVPRRHRHARADERAALLVLA